MNNEKEEFLPKWIPNTTKPPSRVGQVILKGVLVSGLLVFGLGIATMTEHSINGMKGRH
jgi:hypothetical protein